MTRAAVELRGAFAAAVRGDAVRLGGDTLVVACSGGMDSTVLLHLLRFTPDLRLPTLHVAHVQHRMRPEAEADAQWVAGLCRAWEVPCTVVRLETPPAGETEAREARWRALDGVRTRTGARWVALAHHRDDQAETVLHRIARGTGVDGLAAMRRFGPGDRWRPLLSFSRGSLAAYAKSSGLTWREDDTNAWLDRARNVLRHKVLPDLERHVARGAARHLAELAELAAGEREAWSAALAVLLEAADVRREGAHALSLDAAVLGGWPAALRARVLRATAGRLGRTLSASGTRVAAEFISSGVSGHGVHLAGGVRVERALDRIVVRVQTRDDAEAPGEALVIDRPGAGQAGVCIGGRRWSVRWGEPAAVAARGEAVLLARPRYPLTVRSRRPGDRIRLPYGSKKLKKVLLEAGIPAHLRDRVPVVVDGEGRVLAVAGVTTSPDAAHRGAPRGPRLALAIEPTE